MHAVFALKKATFSSLKLPPSERFVKLGVPNCLARGASRARTHALIAWHCGQLFGASFKTSITAESRLRSFLQTRCGKAQKAVYFSCVRTGRNVASEIGLLIRNGFAVVGSLAAVKW